jgi:uncharacterized protein (TIGR01777 family)
MKSLVTGATGMVGRRLLEILDEPVVLTRDTQRCRSLLGLDNASVFYWDPAAGPPPPESLHGVKAIYHLAGEPVAEGRWTTAKRNRIRDSRVIGTRHLVQGIARADAKPDVLVSASAIGIYGDRGDEVLDESSAPGTDFLAEVCERWEAEAQAAEEFGVRVVNPRIGIVLGRHGGALAKMLLPFKLGMGGRLGNGRQYMSWIHVDDLAALLRFAAQNSPLSGPICAVAPKPVTNAEFTRELAGALHRPAFFPVPGIALKLIVGQFAEVLLGSQRIVPTGAQRVGYSYQFAKLPDALRDLLDQ